MKKESNPQPADKKREFIYRIVYCGTCQKFTKHAIMVSHIIVVSSGTPHVHYPKLCCECFGRNEKEGRQSSYEYKIMLWQPWQILLNEPRLGLVGPSLLLA